MDGKEKTELKRAIANAIFADPHGSPFNFGSIDGLAFGEILAIDMRRQSQLSMAIAVHTKTEGTQRFVLFLKEDNR